MGWQGRTAVRPYELQRIIMGDQSSLPILQDRPSSVPDDSADDAC
jgi:hypothetical protein